MRPRLYFSGVLHLWHFWAPAGAPKGTDPAGLQVIRELFWKAPSAGRCAALLGYELCRSGFYQPIY